MPIVIINNHTSRCDTALSTHIMCIIMVDTAWPDCDGCIIVDILRFGDKCWGNIHSGEG